MCLEQLCKTAVLVRPGNLHCMAPIVGTIDPWNVSNHNGFELTGIQVPPAPRTMVIPWARIATGWTTERLIFVNFNPHVNRLLSLVESYVGDGPGSGKTEYFRIECQFI